MNCPEIFGSEFYFVMIAIVVGGILNVIKRTPILHADLVPVAAFLMGWAADTGVGLVSCDMAAGAAALSGLGGGMAGLSAAGGHEAAQRVSSKLGEPFSRLADRLLGRARSERENRPKGKSVITMLLIAVLTFGSMGCVGGLDAVSAVVRVVGSAIEIVNDVASRVDAYFARHPNQDNAEAVADIVNALRDALAGDERDKAVALYADLLDLLDTLGIPQAAPPAGGAETTTAEPQPFTPPTVAEFRASL